VAELKPSASNPRGKACERQGIRGFICRDRLAEQALLFHHPDRVFDCDLSLSRNSGVAFRRSTVNGSAPFSVCFPHESSLEIRDQSRKRSRLLIRREMTTGQALDLEAELAQSFLCKVDLPVFKRIFIAATHEKLEPIAISHEEGTEVESIALRFVIDDESRSGGEIE